MRGALHSTPTICTLSAGTRRNVREVMESSFFQASGFSYLFYLSMDAQRHIAALIHGTATAHETALLYLNTLNLQEIVTG
ncbi:hypothetical protein I7I50_02044 [Histoplasma capsulatum G186AR]|uniref:Uncharacterized protein n=1 Tax=Ajellomyces capsulatus TaxID=5037 RepID=A0A8H7YCG5_AJECA|nr:hypothetical protein I7I52_12258 [Histoplasma capsulatum]QSS71272.1 hypothetical protein I7I50_02044 [Histoplasma capsulatum G186AR]